MLEFQRLDIAAKVWIEEIQNFGDRTVFQTPAWLAFVASTQNAEPIVAALREGQRTVGFFTGLVVRKCGLRILGSPFPGWTTAYMGLCLSSGVTRQTALKALVAFAFEELQCVHVEVLDRHLTLDDFGALGIQYSPYKGFQVDLTGSEDAIFSNMSSACRRCIRKAQKHGVIIEEAHDLTFVDDYYPQLVDVFQKRSLVPTYGIERVRQLINHVHPTGHLLLLRARDSEGRCIATGIYPALNGTMYFWGGASRQEYQDLRPNECLHWYAMRYWKQRGMTRYDMGGSGDYKRKYGGQEITVPWCRASKYPWIGALRVLSKHVIDWRQACLGRAHRALTSFY